MNDESNQVTRPTNDRRYPRGPRVDSGALKARIGLGVRHSTPRLIALQIGF